MGVKQCGKCLAVGEDKEKDLESPEGIQPYRHLILAQGDSFQISDLQKYEKINLCCFKTLSLWSFVKAAIGN